MLSRTAPALVVAGLLGLVIPAAAQEAPTGLQSLLGRMGVLAIPSDDVPDYRERAPLVVPPSTDLPLPRDGETIRSLHPDWPADPDMERQRAAKALERLPIDQRRGEFYSGRALRPSELRRDRAPVTRSTNAPTTTVSPELSAGRERQTSPGVLSLIWGDSKPVQFAGEPTRTRLTEPPTGYFTPSPNAPYGVVGKDKYTPRVGSPYDRLLVPGDPAGPR